MKIKMVLSLMACGVLAAQDIELKSIEVVGASKTAQSKKETTSNMEIITSQELQEKRFTTLLEVMRFCGMSITQSGGMGQQSSFFLNGFSSGNTLVMVDGIKYNDPTSTEGQAGLEHIMVDGIEQIEIIKGSASGVWGANAVAGVINIVTKKPTKELQANLDVEAGSFRTKKINTNLSQKLDDFSYLIGLNLVTTDGVSAQTPHGESPDKYENDGYKNRTLNLKFGYKLSKNDEIKFNMLDIYAKTEYDSWGAPDSANEIAQKNRVYKVELEHILNSHDYVRFSHSKSVFKKDDPNGWSKHFEGLNDETALDAKLSYLSNSFILAGANMQSSKDKVSNKELKSKGLYLTNSNIIDKLVLQESLRVDSYDTFKDETTLKLGAKYNFSDDMFLSANYATAYKTPSLSQLYTPYYGNENLTPERTKSSDISLHVGSFEISGFYSEVTNLIGYDPYSYVNEQIDGVSKFKGFELSYKNEIYENLFLDTKYNHLWAKDSENRDLNRRVKESVKVAFDYYGAEKSHFALMANYAGERYDDMQKTKQTGKYTIVSAVANYDLDKNLKIYLKADNLSDKLYQEVDGYATLSRSLYAGFSARY